MGLLKLFSFLYDKTLNWSRHRHAPYYLAGVSFAESSFFPIPPDVMLVSMGLANPQNSWRNAWIATLCSVLGGAFGYLLGFLGIELLEPYITASSYAESYVQVTEWFKLWGVWIVVIAGFTPLPYKLFTITAGAMSMAFLPFMMASFIGRSLRFFLVSSLMIFTGEKLHQHLRRYVDIIGWSMLIIFVIVYIIMR